MKYIIKDYKGRIIAKFTDAGDRDICIEALRDNFDDCEFTAEEDQS